jgi:hypothetical protein
MKVFCTAFVYLQLIFLRKEIGKKLLTQSCSQFHQHFTYKFFVRMLYRQLFSSYMYVVNAAETTLVQKICT